MATDTSRKNSSSRKYRLLKFFNSDWLITLTSTMIGVFAAIYLSDLYNEQALINKKNQALQKIHQEIERNRQSLEKFVGYIKPRNEAITTLFGHISNSDQLIVKKSQLKSFLEQVDKVFDYERHIELDDDTVQVKGTFNFDVNSELVTQNLSSIAWTSYKQTEYMGVTDFNCLTIIVGIYKQQETYNKELEKWRSMVLTPKFIKTDEGLPQFIESLNNLTGIQYAFLESYYDFVNIPAENNCLKSPPE